MTRKLNNWSKRTLAGLLSMSLLVFCMLPVSAATNAHTHSYEKADKYTKITYNEGNHTIITFQRYSCKINNCTETYGQEIERETQSHDMEYLNFSDNGGIIHYRVRCKVCGFEYGM